MIFQFKNFREEYLYCILIDLMRSPETLKKLTKSCLSKYKEKLKNDKLLALNH